MPRATRKYKAAIALAREINLAINDDQEVLYRALNERGYQWDSQSGVWQSLPDLPADPPTDFVMIRLWCANEVIEEVVNDVIKQIQALGLRLMEQSTPYPCRPPKQLESRVYLKFLPEKMFRKIR